MGASDSNRDSLACRGGCLCAWGLVLSTADEFREKAEECRQQAEKAISPRDKAVWLRIAESWLKMAQQVDQAPPKRKQ
jgi:hypothetical protein